MKRIIIELPEKYDEVLSITAMGGAGTCTINLTTGAFDLSKGSLIINDGDKWIQSEAETEGE